MKNKCNSCNNLNCDDIIYNECDICCNCRVEEEGLELENFCSQCKDEYYADQADTLRKALKEL